MSGAPFDVKFISFDDIKADPKVLDGINRFENIPIEKDGHLCWDVETLLKEIHTAIQKAGTFDSLGFDTWGVDFGLLDTDGHLLANPVHYRDARTNGKPEQAVACMPAEELYAHTGNQIMAINTLFQLLALQEQEPELLQKAEQVLFMLVGVFPISKITAVAAHCTDSSCNCCTAQVRRILMEHFIEFLIFGFTVFIAMNQLFDIALLFQGSGSYAFYGIPVLADNTNQVGERFLIYTNRIDKVDTAVDDSDLIAGCNIQSTHLLYNSVAL